MQQLGNGGSHISIKESMNPQMANICHFNSYDGECGGSWSIMWKNMEDKVENMEHKLEVKGSYEGIEGHVAL
ncbi:unnamed protein product [Camellia sinensis]